MPKLSNLAVRVWTAAIAAPVVVYLLLWGPRWGFIALLAAACLVAAVELFQLTLSDQPLLKAWGVVATLAVLGVMMRFHDRPVAIMSSLAALVIGGLVVGLARPEPVASASARVGWLVAGPLYLGTLIGAIGLLFLKEHGRQWVVFAMLVTWLGDTAAYFIGKAFGRHKLYPVASPNKSVEGAIAGLFGSVAGALLAHFWFLPTLPLASGVAIAALAGALGQMGDLCESLLKRSHGVKDSGWIIPGHGGILDRIDALLFVGPAIWLYAEWLLP